MLVRLRATAADSLAARHMAERLSEPDEDGSEALATSSFEDPASGSWQVDAYYASHPELTDILARIGLWLAAESPPILETVPDENWVAISQAALPPIMTGRFLVHGGHDRGVVGRRRFAIEIDAGEAFGTAHHATTQGCLAAIDRLAHRRRPGRILDLGCGSGLLAIAAARAWPDARIVASDIDPVAVDVAAGNVALNGERRRIRCVTAAGLEHPRLRDIQPYDLVLANILAGPLIRLAPRLSRAIAPGGVAVLSGILGEQAREVIAIYTLAGFRLIERRIAHNWATLMLVRAQA